MTKLNAYNEANEREISSMVGKAMCAYANWQLAKKNLVENPKADSYNDMGFEIKTACASEYEATVRCIEMFVKESIYEIQRYIVDRVEAEFKIKWYEA